MHVLCWGLSLSVGVYMNGSEPQPPPPAAPRPIAAATNGLIHSAHSLTLPSFCPPLLIGERLHLEKFFRTNKISPNKFIAIAALFWRNI